MSNFDLTRRATEVEIAEAINHVGRDASDTIRRLAFERDQLKESIADEAWMHAACLTIAETGQKWGENVRPSCAMQAVYKLKQERDEFARHVQPPVTGMSLQDYFAAAALSGLIGPESDADAAGISHDAYLYADAMLDYRERLSQSAEE